MVFPRFHFLLTAIEIPFASSLLTSGNIRGDSHKYAVLVVRRLQPSKSTQPKGSALPKKVYTNNKRSVPQGALNGQKKNLQRLFTRTFVNTSSNRERAKYVTDGTTTPVSDTEVFCAW